MQLTQRETKEIGNKKAPVFAGKPKRAFCSELIELSVFILFFLLEEVSQTAMIDPLRSIISCLLPLPSPTAAPSSHPFVTGVVKTAEPENKNTRESKKNKEKNDTKSAGSLVTVKGKKAFGHWESTATKYSMGHSELLLPQGCQLLVQTAAQLGAK